MAGRPSKYNTPEEMEVAIDAYFDEENGHTVTGLALFLGFVDRQSLYDYEKREEYSCIIKKARTRVEHEYEKMLTASNCTGAIFALKNMGWRDKHEVEQSGTVVHEHRSIDEARQVVIDRLCQLSAGRVGQAVRNGNGKH